MPQDKDELLQVLITKYAQMYMKLAYAIGVPYDDVEDIVMEAFWSFYRADYGGKLESEKAIKVMLARIVENKCIDYFRKEKRSIKPNEDEDVSELEYVADLSTYDPLQSVISRRKLRSDLRGPGWFKGIVEGCHGDVFHPGIYD